MISLYKIPKISVVMTTFNNSKGVEMCLRSVMTQEYPKQQLEIIVIDNGSSDNSAEVAKKYVKQVYINGEKDGYAIRADGMRKATGDFVYMILEQDMEIRGKHFFQKLVKPLIENEKLIASFTREYPKSGQTWVTRFISHDPIQRDPLFEYLTPSIEETIKEKKNGHYICEFNEGKMPPVTHMLFRVSYLKKAGVWEQSKDYDHDTIIKLIKFGYNLFAYVPSAGTYHHHAKSLKELLNKRVRNLKNHYFPYYDALEYKWLDTTNRNNIFKIIIWIIYANLFFPATIRGIWHFLKFKEWAFLLEPIVTIVTTDIILWTFLTHKVGRRIFFQSIKTLFIGKKLP